MRVKITEVIEPPQGFSQCQIAGIVIKGELKKDTVYEFTEIDEYTEKQRNLFESLPKIYFNSGCFPYKARSIVELREQIKIHLGQGYSHIKYSDHNHKIVTVKYKDRATIPDEIREDFRRGNEERVEMIPKSTTTYTKAQFIDMVENLIREMINNEVLLTKQATKFNEILTTIDFVE